MPCRPSRFSPLTIPPGPVLGQDAVIAAIYAAGGAISRERSGGPPSEVVRSKSPVTDAGIDELKKALPDCKVSH